MVFFSSPHNAETISTGEFAGKRSEHFPHTNCSLLMNAPRSIVKARA